jgi:CDP-paratose 2-epimerase
MIYGNGKQVRDLLYIDDLIDAYLLALKNKEKTIGSVYNIGGGHDFTLSIWKEFSELIADITKQKLSVNYSKWRPEDQKIFYSDNRKITKDLGWKPKISPKIGIKKLYDWIMKEENFKKIKSYEKK